MVKKIIPLLIIVIVIIAIISIIIILPQKPLSDSECIKHLTTKVSDIEFGRSKTDFTINSGLYPTVGIDVEGNLCGKKIAVDLLDSNNKNIAEKAYNTPPFGSGETGYGDYNTNRSLKAGTYKFEFYYGDTLFKTIEISIE